MQDCGVVKWIPVMSYHWQLGPVENSRQVARKGLLSIVSTVQICANEKRDREKTSMLNFKSFRYLP